MSAEPTPKTGEIWMHHSGRMYTVLHVTNTAHPSDKFPPTVVYLGTNGNIWSRPLSQWHYSFHPHTRPQDAECRKAGMPAALGAPFEGNTQQPDDPYSVVADAIADKMINGGMGGALGLLDIVAQETPAVNSRSPEQLVMCPGCKVVRREKACLMCSECAMRNNLNKGATR